jgi:RNA polymerase sigma-70 factor (ECF subfamily)
MPAALNLAPPTGEDDVDDTVLVREAQRSPSAFGLIYERHVDAVYSYLRSRTETPEDAADLTQQTFLQALKAVPAFRMQAVPFRAWLFRIARNVAINHRRSRRTHVTLDLLPERLRPRFEGDFAGDLVHAEALQHIFGLLTRAPESYSSSGSPRSSPIERSERPSESGRTPRVNVSLES